MVFFGMAGVLVTAFLAAAAFGLAGVAFLGAAAFGLVAGFRVNGSLNSDALRFFGRRFGCRCGNGFVHGNRNDLSRCVAILMRVVAGAGVKQPRVFNRYEWPDGSFCIGNRGDVGSRSGGTARAACTGTTGLGKRCLRHGHGDCTRCGGGFNGFFGGIEAGEVPFEHQARLGVKSGHAAVDYTGDRQENPLRNHKKWNDGACSVPAVAGSVTSDT